MEKNQHAPPSVDPADNDSMIGMANTILRKYLQSVDDMLPARVVSYDRATNRATVAPMVAILTTSGSQVARAQVAAVPVFRFGGGGMALSFNLKTGDLGWMKSSDRDISIFLQSLSSGPPNTMRLHTFEDSMFFPDAMRGLVIDGEDNEAAVLQTLDGSHRVVLSHDRVSLIAGASRFDLTASGVNYVGGPFTINGVTFDSHVHSGVESGPSTTGGPL